MSIAIFQIAAFSSINTGPTGFMSLMRGGIHAKSCNKLRNAYDLMGSNVS